jgi:hypothetical protein
VARLLRTPFFIICIAIFLHHYHKRTLISMASVTPPEPLTLAPKAPPNPNLEAATFAGGCFWGLELAFQRIMGVEATFAGIHKVPLPIQPINRSVAAILGMPSNDFKGVVFVDLPSEPSLQQIQSM